MAISQDKLEELKARADIVEVIGAQVRLRRTGRNFVGLCPFHNEKTPSFSVNAERGFFHCFGCGAGGTVFNFVMRIEGLTFPEAVRSLARRYGVTIPEREERGATGAGDKPGERDAMVRANQVAAEFFAHVLWNTPDGAAAREYLNRRGVGADTARAFVLGFAPPRPASLAKALEKRGLVQAGIKLGLLKQDPGGCYDMFRARLMFPIRDAQGRAIAFGGRVLDDRLPKYINSPESPLYSKARSVYGVFEARNAIAKNDRAIVVEGYLDAISVWQAGFKDVVASLGTSLTVEQLRLLGRYTRNVIACFDGDEAGRKASMRALEVFLAAGLLGRGIFIPTGFDPDTLIRDRGADAFRDLIESAEPLADYFIREQAGTACGSIAERARAAQRVAEMLRNVTNPFEFDLLARKAAGMLEVSEEVLRAQARLPGHRGGAREAQAAAAQGAAAPPAQRDAVSEAEIGLLALALARPELRGTIISRAPPASFVDPAVAVLLGELCRSEKSEAEVANLVAERLSEAQQSRLSALMTGSAIDEPDLARQMAGDYVAALERGQRNRDVEVLRREVSAADDPEQATAKLQELIERKREPAREGN